MWAKKEDYLKYHRDRMKSRYKRWRDAGVCGKCGEFSSGKALCNKHRLAHAKSWRGHYKRIKNARKQRVRAIARQDEGNS